MSPELDSGADTSTPLSPSPEMATRLVKLLKEYWGYPAFRPDQKEAVAAIASGRDTVVVLPTGGGKSLCYQLPALLRGRALVVSPLISLMQDQVSALRQLGIEAEFLNSSVPQDEGRLIISRWRQNQVKLLYVAPERLLSDWFFNFIGENPPAFFAIDEAHCISQWGHDFRPEYRRLSILRDRFPDVPICALTATATETVRDDIAQQAKLNDPAVIVGSFDRPNLHYRVERRSDRRAQVEDVLRAHAGKGGIVYCISRKDTESLADYLKGAGFKVAAYHAGLSADMRSKVQADFTAERLDAVVATVAFGMGIDRSNVRFVVHSAMPASIEAYQQETGRAGRDGLPAECVMLYSNSDAMKWRGIYDNSENSTEAMNRARADRLREMDQYASSNGCRHQALVEYFGQRWTQENCGNCDNCSDGPTNVESHPDSTTIAQKILSCVVRLQERYGMTYVTKVLRGETDNVQPAHCGLSTFGLMAGIPAAHIRRWIDDCLSTELLIRTGDEYPVLKVTAEGWKVLRNLSSATMSVVEKARTRSSRQDRVKQHGKNAALGLSPDEQRLFDALRAMRLELARERKVAAYVILHDTSLVAIAQAQPASLEALERVPGIGARKLEEYGDEILQVIEEWEQEG